MDLNRRDFLKAAGAATVAGAAMTSVAIAEEAATSETAYPKGTCAADYEYSPGRDRAHHRVH